jgi:hypothetical protein
MKNLCPMQEVCQHFTTNDDKPTNHDVRNKFPCYHWLSYDCLKIQAIYDLIHFCTGQATACSIEKRDKVMQSVRLYGDKI